MVENVWAVYFSPTHTTKKIVTTIASVMAEYLHVPQKEFDFTLPKERETSCSFLPNDIVVLGTPVYAGRVPNVLLPFLHTIKANGAIGIPINVYGNRHFDDATVELRDIMEEQGFVCPAAAACVGEHAFSRQIAKDRPDALDLKEVTAFAAEAADMLKMESYRPHVDVPGRSPSPEYYKPRRADGSPIDIRKVRSLVSDSCDACGLCAKVCPMGSICEEDIHEYQGICIKCGACIKGCPRNARYYTDPDFLFHKKDLERHLGERKSNYFWLQKMGERE